MGLRRKVSTGMGFVYLSSTFASLGTGIMGLL